jgi:hypothetical protein
VEHVGATDTAPGFPPLNGTAWEYHTFRLPGSSGLPGKGFMRTAVALAL